jgi:hypothetical protein
VNFDHETLTGGEDAFVIWSSFADLLRLPKLR